MLEKRIDHELEVRLLRPEDAQALFDLIDRNRQHLRPWFEMVDITQKVSDTAAWIDSMLARRGDLPRGWCGILADGKLVGAIGVTSFEREKKRVEIGYYLAGDACGRGIATRACAAMLDYLFAEAGINRVEMRVAANNVRSIRLAGKLGFTCEGRLREADLFDSARRDLLIYGLLAREWDGKK